MTAPPHPDSQPRDPGPSATQAVAVFILLTAFLFILRLAGPSNLTDNDQERPASYVLDALRNGHGFVQFDWTGDISSKPPLYTWLAAAASAVAGHPSLATLYLPCALAILAAACLVAWMVRSANACPRIAFLAGLFVIVNPLSAKLVALARTDAVFTGTVALTAALAFRAWITARNPGPIWIAAWLAAALATLTKGPLGILLGFAGLFAWFTERRRHAPPPWHRSQVTGIALWLVVCGGWFLLAWNQAGDALIRKMIQSELVGHVLNREGPPPGVGLVVVPAYFLGRFAPWSLLAFWGLWRAFRHPEPSAPARWLQRFAAAWILVGLVTLGLASHQRGDLVAPLLPAGAILAAFPAATLVRTWTTRRLLTGTVGFSLAFGFALEFQRTHRRHEAFAESRGMATLADAFRQASGNPDTLAHVDAPFALQWELGTMHRALSGSDAADHLLRLPDSAVAVRDLPPLEAALGPAASRLRIIAQWPEPGTGAVRILRLLPPQSPPPLPPPSP